MRLWHEALLSFLPRQQLLGQYRDCCALRGKGWGRKRSTVDYVFKHSISYLYIYHMKVTREMIHRGYSIDPNWCNPYYRGKNCDPCRSLPDWEDSYSKYPVGAKVYPEHDSEYLKECLNNLKEKGVHIDERLCGI